MVGITDDFFYMPFNLLTNLLRNDDFVKGCNVHGKIESLALPGSILMQFRSLEPQ